MQLWKYQTQGLDRDAIEVLSVHFPLMSSGSLAQVPHLYISSNLIFAGTMAGKGGLPKLDLGGNDAKKALKDSRTLSGSLKKMSASIKRGLTPRGRNYEPEPPKVRLNGRGQKPPSFVLP